jgi:hypothetical protein
METSRDIALIFLSLEALVASLVPLALLALLVYAVHRLRGVVRDGLRVALSYAEKARLTVERASHAIAEPFIMINSKVRMVQAIVQKLFSRRCA